MLRETKKLRFASAEASPGVGISVAPLIDIVFLLICFYLFVAQLISSQKDPSIELASIASELTGQEAPAEFVINLRRDAVVTVGGRDTPLPVLRTMLNEQVAAAARSKQSLRVVIRADRRQQYGRLDEVFKVCRQAGVRRIIFRTVRKEPP